MDFYKEWFGIPEASRPPNHYQLLGLRELETERDKIDQATRDRMRILQKYQVGKYAEASVQLMMEISIARAELLNAVAKSRYDASVDETVVAEPVAPEAQAAGQLDVFKSIVEMAVFRGGITEAQVPLLLAQGERLQVTSKIAEAIIRRAFKERERLRRWRKRITTAGIAAVALVALGLVQLIREGGTKLHFRHARRLAEQEQYREAITALNQVSPWTVGAWRARTQRREYATLEQARDLSGEALTYERKNPEDYPGIVERYQQVADLAPESKYAEKAKQRISAVEGQVKPTAIKKLEELKEKAGELALKGEHDGAMAVWDEFPQNLLLPQWKLRVEQERGRHGAEIEKPRELCTVAFRIPFKHRFEERIRRMAWSPDGQTVLLSHSGSPSMFALDVRSKTISPWVLPQTHFPAFSPDGRTVAVCTTMDGIQLVDLTTGEKRRCFAGEKADALFSFRDHPSFTHDGQRICYMSTEGGSGDIWLAGIDGGNRSKLTEPNWRASSPQASPVEGLVAYCAEATGGIWVQRTDGDRAVVLKTNVGRAPAWSPDGRIISYEHKNNIWLMDKTGEKKLQLTSEKATLVNGYAWCPRGDRMIYHVTRGAEREFRVLALNLPFIRRQLGLEEEPVAGRKTPEQEIAKRTDEAKPVPETTPAEPEEPKEVIPPEREPAEDKAEELKKRLQPENQAIADKLLLYEPFDDNRNNWPITPSGPAARYIKDGVYVLIDDREKTYTTALLERTFSDFVFQVTVSADGPKDGLGEIRFRRDADSCYGMSLRFGEQCDLWRWHFRDRSMGKYVPLSPNIVQRGTEAKNIIEARCVGNRIKGWFNGVPTVEILGPPPRDGRFELVASGNQRMMCTFDDLIVFSVKQDALPPYSSSLPEPVAPELRSLIGVPLHIERWDQLPEDWSSESEYCKYSTFMGRFVMEPRDRSATHSRTVSFTDYIASMKATCLTPPTEGNWGYGMYVRRPIGVKGYEWRGYGLRLTNEGVDIVLRGPDKFQVLADNIAKDKIQGQGKENILEALCKGNEIKFYLNGSFVYATTITDPNFMQGGLAEEAWGKGIKVAFDDLLVYALKPPDQIAKEKEQVAPPPAAPKTDVAKPDVLVDLNQFAADIKSVNELIDAMKYGEARTQAEAMKEKYPKFIETKLANLDRIEALRKKCFEQINSGKVKLDMGDISKRYAYIGAIWKADEKGLTAKMTKKWGELSRGEVTDFYRKTSDRKNPDDVIAIAAFFMEGAPDLLRLDAARKRLDKAAGMGSNVAELLEYAETLKRLVERSR